MTFSLPLKLRRAMLLGMPFGLAACDIARFVQDPTPILEQTWNIPAESASISVASILPPGVAITPDSSAFQVSVSAVSFSRRVGDDCAACQAQHGTTAIKPSFVVATGSSTPLPANVVSGALVGGLVNVQVTNNLSFDPLRVKTIAPASSDPAQQGRMVIVVRSGSLVVGKDSVNGVTTTFPAGTVLTRPIALQTGNITGALSVDLTLTSPASDNNVFMNANGTIATSAAVPDLRIAQMRMNVVNRTLTSIAGDSIELQGLDESITKKVQSATLEMTIDNPFNVTGNVDVAFGYGPGQAVTKTVSLPTGVDQIRTVALDSADMSNLFSTDEKIGLTISGTVNSPAPIDVTPRQIIAISNRLVMVIRLGGETLGGGK
jgi:hypothetical protein